MGVYFKGMEKPGSCDECPLYCCPHNFADCPAVAVPPHGKLIDADKLHFVRVQIANSGGIVGGYNAVVPSAEIKDAPTIIPAEEGT